MSKKTYTIDNYLGGFSETQYSGTNGTYNVGIAIDPDFALSDPDSGGSSTSVRTSGLLVPTRYADFSGVNITSYPAWLISNPKDTNIYTITNAGFMIRYDQNLANETVIDAATITYIGNSTGSFSSTTTKTVSATVSAGSNRILLAYLNFNGTATGVTVTYGGTPMTLVNSITAGGRGVHMYYLIAPTTGTANLVANWTGSLSGWLTGVEYNGVNQTTPLGTSSTASAAATSVTNNVTSATGELVVDTVTTNSAAPTAGGSQNTRFSNSTIVESGASDKEGSASVSMSWSVPTSQPWVSVAVPLKPTASGNNGNGASYYNNYIYRATGTNINRYGPLNNSPTNALNVWTGATLGSQAALINTTYPTVNGIQLPNHPMHVHGDNALYVGDYNATANPGQGTIHKIKTSKTTNEGDTNNGTTANALLLPFGFLPTDIESYGTDLVTAAVQSTDSNINQGRAALFFWDTTSTTFYRGPLYVSDPLITAMLSFNGELYIWSGNSTRGTRISKYVGGDSLQEIAFLEDSTPPFPGAVSAWGNRIAWGGFTMYPSANGVVFAYGSKDSRLPKGISAPIKSSAAASNPIVTSILNYAHKSFVRPKLLVGWGDTSPNYGIDALSTSGTYASVWRSEMFPVGEKFKINRIRIPLASAVSANVVITPKIYLDDLSSVKTLTVINNSNYPGKRKILYQEVELNEYMGENNFLLELSWSGTQEMAVGFPILIDVEIYDDENN